MKTTVIFLVSVIVFSNQFMESSTAPTDSTIKVTSAAERVVKANKVTSAKGEQSVKDNVTQATSDPKTFAEIKANYCQSTVKTAEFKDNCINDTLKQFVYERIRTSNEALAEFIKAFEYAKANTSIDYRKGLNQVGNWLKGFEDLVANRHNDLENLVNGDPCEARDENIKKLEIAVEDTEATVASFKRIPYKLKAILEKTVIETIVGNAIDVIKVLENLECTENCTENALKEFIYERIGTSNEALAEFIKAFEYAKANTSIDYRKGLNQVGNWLKGFKDLVADRHNDLENLVNGEPCEARDENIKKLEIAVEDTEATVASFKRIPDKLKAILEKTVIETIVGNAIDVIKVLENLECTENCTENALKEFIYERIGTSNEALAEFIKAFEYAKANTSIDYRKGLNQVGDWLKGFKDLVADRHNDLENLVNGDPCEARDENIKKLEIAVEDTEATVASFKRIPDKLKAILEKTVIETIVGNAIDVIKVLESLECTEKNEEKNAKQKGKNVLKQFIYKRIEAFKDLFAEI